MLRWISILRFREAEKLYRDALEAAQHTLGREHRNALISMGNLASVLGSEGRNAEAERMQREVYETRRRVLGPDDPDTVLALDEIGAVLDRERRYAEAVRLLQEAIAVDQRILGPGNLQTVQAEYHLDHVMAVTQKANEAITLLQDAADHGLDPKAVEDLKKSTDWKSLRGDPSVEALIAEMQKRAATAVQKPN